MSEQQDTIKPESSAAVTVYKEKTNSSLTFGTSNGFDLAQRQALALSKSDLIPAVFKGKVENILIALEIATRIGASPFAVMQNLYVVQGKPSWYSQFIISAINSSGRLRGMLRFRVTGDGDEKTCVAYGIDADTGETLESPPVSIKTAKAEGWFERNGSKWKTMPDLMLRYRAAAFFGRLYVPDILMGMHSVEEITDEVEVVRENGNSQKPASKAASLSAELKARAQKVSDAEKTDTAKPDDESRKAIAAAGLDDTEMMPDGFSFRYILGEDGNAIVDQQTGETRPLAQKVEAQEKSTQQATQAANGEEKAPYPSDWPERRKTEKPKGYAMTWSAKEATPKFLANLRKEGSKEAAFEIAYREANGI